MKNSKIVLISLFCLSMFAYQSSSMLEASDAQKSVSVLLDMIKPFVKANNTMMTMAILNGHGYTLASDWNMYICPALKQARASESFIQYVAYTMGFAKKLNNKMYICKG